MVAVHGFMERQCCSKNVFSGRSISLIVKLPESMYECTNLFFLVNCQTALKHLLYTEHFSRHGEKYSAL